MDKILRESIKSSFQRGTICVRGKYDPDARKLNKWDMVEYYAPVDISRRTFSLYLSNPHDYQVCAQIIGSRCYARMEKFQMECVTDTLVFVGYIRTPADVMETVAWLRAAGCIGKIDLCVEYSEGEDIFVKSFCEADINASDIESPDIERIETPAMNETERGIKWVLMNHDEIRGEDNRGKFECCWNVRYAKDGTAIEVEIYRNGVPSWEPVIPGYEAASLISFLNLSRDRLFDAS